MLVLHITQIQEVGSNSPIRKATLKAVNEKEPSALLHTFSAVSIGTLLDNESFRIAISLRTSMCTQHTCKCESIVDENGLHGISC